MAFISVKWKKGRDAEQLGIEMTLRKRIISIGRSPEIPLKSREKYSLMKSKIQKGVFRLLSAVQVARN